MKKHNPTLIDAASDLWRCVYLSESGFENAECKRFYESARQIFELERNHLDPQKRTTILKLFKKIDDTSLELTKRREDTLTAAILMI